MTKWRLIDTCTHSAPWNMAIDEALLECFEKSSFPILRVYTWEPSLSFGRFSKISNNIHQEKLNNISYARRATGGGILVHGDDISYSLILPTRFVKDMGVKKSYSYLCSFILEFYKSLGVDATFALDSNVDCKKSEICLLGNESYDIIVEGKKLGGNAQRHTKKAIFQHGTIPLQYDDELFEAFFKKDSGIKNSATIYTLGVDKTKQELKEILIDSFVKSFECEVVVDMLSDNEMKKANELFEKKYSLDSWNINGK